MAAFSRIKKGDTLFLAFRARAGRCNFSVTRVHRYFVREVDPAGLRAFVSVDGGAPIWMFERDLKKLRRSEPKRK
jgi:hypothetical protein